MNAYLIAAHVFKWIALFLVGLLVLTWLNHRWQHRRRS